jgi:ketosteroid isomerase-like protein
VNEPAEVQAMRELMDGYFKVANAKDSAALKAVLTDKTILFEPHLKPLVGKDAIEKTHQALLDHFDIDAKRPAVGVRVAGDPAVAYGA